MSKKYTYEIKVDYTKQFEDFQKEIEKPENLEHVKQLYKCNEEEAKQILKNTIDLAHLNIKASAVLSQVFEKDLGLKSYTYDPKLQLGQYFVDLPENKEIPRSMVQVINIKAGLYHSMNITSNVLNYLAKEVKDRPKDFIVSKEDYQILKHCKILTVQKLENITSSNIRIKVSSIFGKVASVFVMGKFVVVDYVIDFNFTSDINNDIILGKITYDATLGKCAYNVFMPIPYDILKEIKERKNLWTKQAIINNMKKKEGK